MDIVGLQEVRWPDHGVLSTRGYEIYYSGNNQGVFRKGVAFAVKKTIATAVITFEPFNERMCYIRLKGKFKNISVVCAYAPTEVSEDIDKDDFYEEIEALWNKIPNYDLKILLGDFNAKVGREAVWTKTAGKHSLHSITNDNGSRLLNFAISHDLKVASTSFPRKDIHKSTWNSPSGDTHNQIDHVLIDFRHKSSITNVRSLRGPEIGSDHYLVLIKVYQRISVEKNNNKHKKPETNFVVLKDPNKESEFQHKLDTAFDESRNTNLLEKNLNNEWKSIVETVKKNTEEVCGKKERHERKPWFDNDCRNIIDQRKSAKENWMQSQSQQNRFEYNELNRETKKLLRKKKREWLNGLVRKAEEDRTRNNAKDFYRTLRFFKTQYKPKAVGIKDKNGQLIIQPKEGLEIWKEYFTDLLNGDIRENEITDYPTFNHVEPEVAIPSLEEIKQAIKELKNNKAPGQDGINAEIWRGSSSQKITHADY